jgi:triosephosphate isomerase (TIM)
MRGFLVAGNWKMNGSQTANAALIEGIRAGMPESDTVELMICPPFPYLAAAAELVAGSRLKLGAQTVSEHAAGAYTGETAGAMLRDVGCEFVLVGHSERRALYGESSEAVAAKYVAAQVAGLKPVLCVGETLAEREAGATEEVIGTQLEAVLDRAGVGSLSNAVIAYEPVWAIGTGETASPEQAQDVHAHIRRLVDARDAALAGSVQILYGGSVKGDNAAGLFSMPDIDGGLIGGASLKSDNFLAIANAAASIG